VGRFKLSIQSHRILRQNFLHDFQRFIKLFLLPTTACKSQLDGVFAVRRGKSP